MKMEAFDQRKVVGWLRDGKLVAMPTDTVYGVMADMGDVAAVERIFELKGRSREKPLAVLVSSVEMLKELVAEVTVEQRALMERFWPGALTLVFRKKEGVADMVTGGRETIGVRMPARAGVLEVIEALGRPVVATSVNFSGAKSLNEAAEIKKLFPELLVVEDRDSGVGVESTVVDVSGELPVVLREGYIKRVQIEEVLGKKCG